MRPSRARDVDKVAFADVCKKGSEQQAGIATGSARKVSHRKRQIRDERLDRSSYAAGDVVNAVSLDTLWMRVHRFDSEQPSILDAATVPL
jgi:hypothetical protein